MLTGSNIMFVRQALGGLLHLKYRRRTIRRGVQGAIRRALLRCFLLNAGDLVSSETLNTCSVRDIECAPCHDANSPRRCGVYGELSYFFHLKYFILLCLWKPDLSPYSMRPSRWLKESSKNLRSASIPTGVRCFSAVVRCYTRLMLLGYVRINSLVVSLSCHE